MTECSFCGSTEDKPIPLCGSCGSLRYPVTTHSSSRVMSGQEKLKYSAIAALTLLTPGSFIALALVGASRFGAKQKIRRR